MKSVTMSEFKDKCISMLNKLHLSNDSLVVTRRGQPVATVSAYTPTKQKKVLGGRRGLMTIRGDVANMSSSEDWNMLK